MRRLTRAAALAITSLAVLAATTRASVTAGASATTAASVTRDSASGGGITATLSYSGQGITAADVRLQIVGNGKVLYNRAVPRTGCFHACVPDAKQSVHIVDLYGDGGADVVLDLFSGGADCCTIDDVYVPSAAVDSYVIDSHNFGEAGAAIRNIGPKGRPVFVSADGRFYCRFTDCAASGLPLEILEFEGERFVDITGSYPKLIAADAARWLDLYYRNVSDGAGLIAAYAADQYELGAQTRATARTVLQRQLADGKLKTSFVRQLTAFLKTHNYG